MGNDGMLVVKFGALQQASDDIDRALKELKAKLEQLHQVAQPLVDTWKGDAQQAYYQRQDKWTKAADDLTIILRDIRVAVDDSKHDYLTTEKKATSLFQ
jgi:WXG100 family type VII secretion target